MGTNMMNHNWKLLGLWLALALLCACLLGGAALAQDAEPSVSLRVEGVQIKNGQVNGRSEYKVYVDLENTNTFEMAWLTNPEGVPDENDWHEHNGRVYTPSENGDMFENGSYRIGQNHGQPDTIAVYALVQLDDSEDWITPSATIRRPRPLARTS